MADDVATLNRSSIDLSIELERQLESESLPGTPAFHTYPKDVDTRTSLDPHVLAHIVTQLRDSVTHITRERDDMVHQLAESHSREAEFKDSLALLTERCASLEKDLEAARKKCQDDDEAISMLRSKVEESRRGLMRLQSERNAETKRMTLDLGHPRTPSFGGGPRSSSHRSSFTPLAGSGHPGPPSSFRRQSTVSESDPAFAEFVASLPGSPGDPLVFNESADGSSSLVNRRRSMFGAVNRSSVNHFEGRVSPSMAEAESVKRELIAAKAELEETRHELTEANEAREASESCVKALRDFISQLGAGDASGQGESVRLPPLPTDSGVKYMEPEPKPQKASGWGGLKLWRVDTGTTTSVSQASASASPGGRPSIDSYRSTHDRDSASPSTAVPLRNKFGAFFARGSSIGSLTIPAPHSHQDEPILNGSDVSSLTEEMSEPISPALDKAQPVMVREAVEEVENTNRNGYNQDAVTNGNGDNLKVVPL